jgi:hypothetical protein
MKKILLVLFLLLFTVKIFAQQFSQYNTGTLYDSFENPAQRAFVPDTSKKYAFNFLIPNFNANFFLSGNGQATLKGRAFLNEYNNDALMINQGKTNLANANANIYWAMFKAYTSLNGNVEIGFSAQTKVEARGIITDETLAAFNGTNSFIDGSGNNKNIFNDHYTYQTYNQFSLTYRENINKDFSIGFKLSALLGVEYQKLDINSSSANYDKFMDTAGVALKGTYQAGFEPGHASVRDYLPTFRNPGAAISIGTTYRTEDGYIIQANIKDLGFIHWNSQSNTYNFDNSANIKGLSTSAREDSIYNKVYGIVHNGSVEGSFTTPIDGRAEVSASRIFWLDDDKTFKYSPTLIASKELFYTGFVGALVNPFQYQKYVVTLTTTYDDLKTFNLGLQFMVKTYNYEFFIGSDRLTQTSSLLSDAISKNPASVFQNSSYTGASLFLGFSLKFGPVIEHPMNASVIPNGEKGFLGRIIGRLFKTDDND